MRDDLVEAIHEALDLRPNGLSHPHLCHQLNILLLQQQCKLSNLDTNISEESVIVSDGVLISEVEMHARVVFGAGKAGQYPQFRSIVIEKGIYPYSIIYQGR